MQDTSEEFEITLTKYALHCTGNNLQGNFLADFTPGLIAQGVLRNLRVLTLGNNALTGTIPAALLQSNTIQQINLVRPRKAFKKRSTATQMEYQLSGLYDAGRQSAHGDCPLNGRSDITDVIDSRQQ